MFVRKLKSILPDSQTVGLRLFKMNESHLVNFWILIQCGMGFFFFFYTPFHIMVNITMNVVN